jgi:transcription-repair coupling factor (superfamily II helicase)
MLSTRFQTSREQKEIVAKLKECAIDIVVGTHRLIQKDIVLKTWAVIIDEEHRFWGKTQGGIFKKPCPR